MNNVKVFGLMALLTALVVAAGGAVGGQSGMILAFALAGGMNFFMYWKSSSMVLRMYGAQTIDRSKAPELYEMVDRLRQRAGLPMPTVAIAPQDQPNAFATGRNPENAVVCVTSGILRVVTREELEGVIAHELAHIKNRDMLLQTFTATLAGAISYLANMAMWGAIFGGRDSNNNAIGAIAMMILAPIAASMVQMAISRQREFKADAVGAEICGRPLALAGALQKLDAHARRIPMNIAPAAAPVAQVNPLAAHGGGMARLNSLSGRRCGRPLSELSDNPYAGRVFVVMNPAAGKDDPERVRRQIGGALAVRGISFDLQETEASGDAERLARDAVAKGYRAVVAAGGDGTIAEVITGLARSEVPLGIIPRGTANQLAANLGIPADMERAVEVLLRGTPLSIDIGQLSTGRYFALIAGAGWDAEVMAACTRELKERWGFGAYLFSGLRASVTPSSALFHITADGAELEIRAATVLIANAGHLFHGLFPVEVQIAPRTSFRDGLFDVCVFAPQNITDVAAVLWKVARRRYAGDDRMLYLQARDIRIATDPPTITQVDGDCVGQTPLEAVAIPGGVRVLVPPSG